MDSNSITQVATLIIPLVIAIVFHEVAHGLVARRLGDPTAARMGRLTLNPLKHVDPVGTVILPTILALTKAPIFGWAKPVPVNFRLLRNPRRDMVLVALAGPGMNFLLAGIATAVLALMAPDGQTGGFTLFVVENLVNFVLINIFLAIFNLIPLPPFDGGHVVEGALPRPLAAKWRSMERYALLIFIALLLVLPAISPSLNIVAKFVVPIVRAVSNLFLGVAGLA